MNTTTHLKINTVVLVIVLSVSGCDPKAPVPVDSVYAPPILGNLRLSQDVINTDTILVGSTPKPEDIVTVRLIVSADLVASISATELRASLRSSSGGSIPVTYSFADGGAPPDTVASDNRYTGEVSFGVQRALSGLYTLQVSAMDRNGLTSNALTGTVRLIRANLPPVLTDLEADSVVSLSGGNTLLQLRITATDPNGVGDIDRVWFDSFRPDSTPSSGNPFLMFDDGNASSNGDLSAGDGIFGLKVLFSGAAEGTYRFSFRATDRAKDSSNVIDHFLTVVP